MIPHHSGRSADLLWHMVDSRMRYRQQKVKDGRQPAPQVQFIARGPSGKGRVSADMYQDEQKQWQYYYLLVDLDGGRGRISIVEPHQM